MINKNKEGMKEKNKSVKTIVTLGVDSLKRKKRHNKKQIFR